MDQEPATRAQPGNTDIVGLVVPNPHGLAMAVRSSVVPLVFAGGAYVAYLTGHYCMRWFFLIVGFARSMDRRPQAVLRLTGIELRRSRSASLQLIGWNTITSVTNITYPGARS